MRAFLHTTFALLMSVALIGGAAPASGATITYTDNACASFTVTGSGGTYQLICSKLACSIQSSAGVNIVPIGTGTTLTASCNPAADQGFTWSASAGNPDACPIILSGSTGTTQALRFPSQAVSGCVYQVDGTSTSQGGGSATITLGWSDVAPQPPTGCVASVSTTPTVLTSAGGTANLNVTGCSPAGLTYNWSRNGLSLSASQSAQDTLAANGGALPVGTSYQVNVCNGAACATFPASPLTASVPGSGGGGGGGGISCAAQGFSKTMSYNWNWATTGTQFVQTYNDAKGPMGANGIVVIAFTPTAGPNAAGSVSVSEYPGGLGNIRAVSVSTMPCDFSRATPWTRYGYNMSTQYTVAPYFIRGIAQLVAGTTYYLNIANRDSTGGVSCDSQCEIRVTANKP